MVKNNQAQIGLLRQAIVLVLALGVTPITGAPGASTDDKVTTPDQQAGPFDLPFLQFKNGGIRVNFAGYHAEAGLGGLLGGSDAKGGLYASAGTPWGPSASAGLGGSLGGQDGSARGGLHARAGLGNGGPEAAAGLGGMLDGSGRSGGRAAGGLYAGATAGGPAAVAGLGGSIDDSGHASGSKYAGSTDGGKTQFATKDVTNIQAIKPPPPPSTGETVYIRKSGAVEPSTTLEFKVPGDHPKKEVSSSIVTRELANPGPQYNVADTNAVIDGSDTQDIDVSYPARRYYRKRLRGSPVRKSFYKFFTTNTAANDGVPIPSTSTQAEGKIDVRLGTEDKINTVPAASAQYGVYTKTKSTTLFDDIFNIPISALTAVNQLLNNKSG